MPSLYSCSSSFNHCILATRVSVLCPVSLLQEEVVTIQTVRPFDVTYKLMNTKFKLIDTINFEEAYVVMTELHITSPWQLLIIGSHFNSVCVCVCIVY